MPKNKKIISEKYYSDILYSYLQVNSTKTESGRIIPKKMIKYVDLANILGVSRQTISKRFNKLLELGLVIPKDNNYELAVLDSSNGFLIPEATLRIMSNTLSENTINVYIFLCKKFIANKEKPCDFTIYALKDYCGLGTKGDTNNYIITDILLVLQKLGLIEYSITTNRIGDNSVKTHYHLNKVSLTCC